MFRKIILIVLISAMFVFPLAADTRLLNLGYNVQGDFWGIDDLKLRSVSLNYTRQRGDVAGFYFQANPYYGLSFKSASVAKLSDWNELIVGSNFLLGYGGDLNFGPIGLILGGGAFVDVQYYDYNSGYTFTTLLGIGGGAHLYFQPGSGTFVVNAGMNFAWHPWAYEFYESDSGSYTNYGMSTVNFNIGVGWRLGGAGSSSNTDW